MSKSLLLIDISGIFWAAWHATVALPTGGEAYAIAVASPGALRCDEYDHVAICCDASPYTRRKALLPTYKAQRDAPPAAALDQFRRVKERLVADGHLLWSVPGEEADDVIATAVEFAKRDGMSVTIASSDKDLLQLVDDENDIRVFSPSKQKTFDRAGVIETWGVPPEMLLDALALQGDTSDNVPGIPGVGKKNAAKLLTEYGGTLDAVLGNCDKIPTPKMQENVFQGAAAARLAKQVIELRRDCPIRWEELFEKREVKPVSEATPAIQDGEFDPISLPPPKSEPSAEAPVATPVMQAPKSTALALAPVEWAQALEPRTLASAQTFAIAVANSRLYPRISNPDAALVVIVRGRSIGLGAIQALDVIHYFDGKTALHAHLITEMVTRHPDCEWFRYIAGDNTFAEYHTKQRGNETPVKLRYTIEQAERAGLLATKPGKEPGNWHKRPDEMLRKTCAVQLGRIVYPGAALGLYALEELGAEAGE
jgi:5'-3' exonuclease